MNPKMSSTMLSALLDTRIVVKQVVMLALFLRLPIIAVGWSFGGLVRWEQVSNLFL